MSDRRKAAGLNTGKRASLEQGPYEKSPSLGERSAPNKNGGKKRRRKSMLPAFCLVVLMALAVGVPLALWITGRGEQPTAPGPDTSPAMSGVSSSDAPASVAPVVSSEPPVSSQVETGPKFSFTEAEVAGLNAMLDEWAAQSTLITRTEDEEGNPLPEPVKVADGGNAVAVWVLDMDSGATYSYRSELDFYYASTMKGPYAAYLYNLAGSGQLDLETAIEVTGADVAGYEGNTGAIKNMPLPVTLTIEELIGYMLRDSDTVALKVLLEHWPASGFVTWAQGLGLANAQALRSVIYGRVSAADAGILMGAVYDVMENGAYGARLKEHLLNTRNPLVTAPWPVARKYGWDEYALHDFAVIYAPHPVLMVVMTDKWAGSAPEQAMFGTVSESILDMLAAHWAETEAA